MGRTLAIGLRKKGEQLIVKLRDIDYSIIYNNKVDVKKQEQVANMVADLDALGVDLEKAIKRKRERKWWD